jgi:hypothetical protein
MLALGAVAASGAQAFEWDVGGQTLSERGVSSETTAGSGGAFALTSRVTGQDFEMNCSSATSGGSIATPGGGSASVTLSGCAVAKPAGCKVVSMPSIEAKTELIEAGGTVYEKFVPKSGLYFAEFTITNCVAAGTYPLKGSFAGLGPQTERLVNRPVSFSNAINSAAGASLKIGKEAATMSGSLEEHLGGALTGNYWRALKAGQLPFNWQIAGIPFSKGQTESVSVSGGPMALEFKILGSSFKVSCTSVSGKNAVINYGGSSEGSLSFSGCAMTTPAGCTVPSTIQTNTVRSSLRNIGGYNYETFVGAESSALFSLNISGCASAGSWEAKGSFTGKGTVEGTSQVSQPLEFSSAISTLTNSHITFGEEPGTLSGSVARQLTGSSVGLSWGAI